MRGTDRKQHKLVTILKEISPSIIGVFEFSDTKVDIFVDVFMLPRIYPDAFRVARCMPVYTEDSFTNLANPSFSKSPKQSLVGTHIYYETREPLDTDDMITIGDILCTKEWIRK